MSDVLRSELLKARTGRSLLYLVLGGVLLAGLTAYGFAAEAEKVSGPGAAVAPDEVVRAWMMMFLFAALHPAVAVAGEWADGVVARTVLMAGSRGRVFAAKAGVAAVTGSVFGAVAVVGGVVSAYLFLPAVDRGVHWTRESTLTLVGVFTCCVAAALWGLFLGWLLRALAPVVAVIVLLTIMVEPAVQRIAPAVSKFLFTIALSSVYLDDKPDLLPVWSAVLWVLAWLALLGVGAHRLFTRRDIS